MVKRNKHGFPAGMDELAMKLPPPRAPGVALWRQIGADLERDIAAGTYPPGAQLPTETTLAQHFAVNRHTIRRALDELSRAGLIRVEQGRGSFVAEDVLDYTVGPRTRFSEWIRRHNMEPSGRMLALEETASDLAVATGLAVPMGAPVVRFRRLGLADGRPVSLSDHFFPTHLRGIAAALRAGDGITAALAAVGVEDYRRHSSKVSARLPTPEEADLLRIGTNQPLLTCENINVDRSGAVVEFCQGRYPTPRVQIIFEP